MTTQMASLGLPVEPEKTELEATREALHEAYKLLTQALDTNLMLSQKHEHASRRWLGRNK